MEGKYMKRIFALTIIMVVVLMSTTVTAYAYGSLDEVINGNTSYSSASDIVTGEGEVVVDDEKVVDDENTTGDSKDTSESTPTQKPTTSDSATTGGTDTDKEQTNQDFINGLNDASNLAQADVQSANALTKGAKKVAAFIIKVLSYFIIAFLAVGVVIDLTYIAIPFTRKFLSNGYTGNAPTANPNGMGGMGGMGGMM